MAVVDAGGGSGAVFGGESEGPGDPSPVRHWKKVNKPRRPAPAAVRGAATRAFFGFGGEDLGGVDLAVGEVWKARRAEAAGIERRSWHCRRVEVWFWHLVAQRSVSRGRRVTARVVAI